MTFSISAPVSQDIKLNIVDEIDSPKCQSEDFSRFEVVAFDDKVQTMMDDKQISWGVQWELARGVSGRDNLGQLQSWWRWSDVTRERLDKLKGRNIDAAWKVRYIMRDEELPRSPATRELW